MICSNKCLFHVLFVWCGLLFRNKSIKSCVARNKLSDVVQGPKYWIYIHHHIADVLVWWWLIFSPSSSPLSLSHSHKEHLIIETEPLQIDGIWCCSLAHQFRSCPHGKPELNDNDANHCFRSLKAFLVGLDRKIEIMWKSNKSTVNVHVLQK